MPILGDRRKTYWERHAALYDRSLGPLSRPFPRMLERIGAAVQGCGSVLEVAAGTGLVTPTLSRAAGQVIATDQAEAMVERTRVRVAVEGLSNVQCEVADVYGLRFADGQFDAAVAANLLHLLPDVPAALAELRRVVRPGGVLVLPTFCHAQTVRSHVVSYLAALTGFPGQRRLSDERLQRLLRDAGLQPGPVEIIDGLIPIGYVEARV